MPTWVGDAALATPLIEALHEQHPDARKDFVIKPYGSSKLWPVESFAETGDMLAAKRHARLLLPARMLRSSSSPTT